MNVSDRVEIPTVPVALLVAKERQDKGLHLRQTNSAEMPNRAGRFDSGSVVEIW